MKEITTWIKEELYPAIYEQADSVFPELAFKPTSSQWQSPYKLDGSEPKKPRKDKTVIDKRYPSNVLEQGGESLSLVDYVMRRDSVEFIQAVRTLADKVNLSLPGGDFNPQQYQERQQAQNLLQQAASYFTFCLLNAETAELYRKYLTQQRGYTLELIEQMQLGFIPSQERLYKHLKSNGFTTQQIQDTLPLNNKIGSSHQLTIPFQAKGQLLGFKFRTIDPNQQSKYLNSNGLQKNSSFFNLSSLKGHKDLVIVEGELDCLRAEAEGLQNVVALAGSSISSQQIASAISAGAKNFTLCYDREPGSGEKIQAAIQALRQQGIHKIYIAQLPSLNESKTDPDSFITQKGAQAFQQVLEEAIPYYNYQLTALFEPYSQQDAEQGLTAKQTDQLKEEIVQLGASLPPLHRDQFIAELLQEPAIQALGITQESLKETIAQLATDKAKEQQKRLLEQAFRTSQDLLAKGQPDKAAQALKTSLEDIQQQGLADDFQKLLYMPTEEEVFQEEATMPEGLNTGYFFHLQGEESTELTLPGGALSIYAAYSGHGKTLTLIDTAIRVAQTYTNKRFIFFTYEERRNKILQYFLNNYLDLPLSRRNRNSLSAYFKNRTDQYIRQEHRQEFDERKQRFFKELIEPGRINIQYVDYDSATLISAIKYLQSHHPDIGGIFIDYFQLLSLPPEEAKSRSSRQEELKQICIALKDAAVSTGLPIILAAQFNREVTNPVRLHPTNIGEAGDIERIANTIIGLWNAGKKIDAKGIANSEKQKAADLLRIEESQVISSAPNPGKMYIEILKSRELSTGWSNLFTLNGNTGKLSNPSNLNNQNKSNRPF